MALDAEFDGRLTLCVQYARRIGGELAAQIYRSPAAPDVPRGFRPSDHLPAATYGLSFERAVLRPVRTIDADLSPVRILGDLFGIPDLQPLSRSEGRALLDEADAGRAAAPPNATRDRRTRRLRVPTLDLTLVGHFLPAYLLRAFGSDFLADLLGLSAAGRCDVVLSDGRLLGFEEAVARPGRRGALVQYGRTDDGRMFGVRVATCDTTLPFGPGSLDSLCRSFLGVGKSRAVSADEKASKADAFRRSPSRAYGYALVDMANTLLLHEAMAREDRKIYAAFGVPEGEAPPMRSTVGRRVGAFLSHITRRAAAGSAVLSTDGRLAELMRCGSFELFDRYPECSRFGSQTGRVHGGLILSRSPTKFWHEAPGRVRDVDMRGCYNRVIDRLTVYWGRPVVFEPGDRAVSLRDAVEFVRPLADDDAWMIRVTGPIDSDANALVRSTEDAVSWHNYRCRRRRGAAAAPGEDRKAGLYSAKVRSGVVAVATWAVVRTPPAAATRV